MRERVPICLGGMWLALVVLLVSATVAAEEGVLFSQQETISYQVEYGPARLAQMGLEIECSAAGQVNARLQARSQGMARRIHPFRIQLDTRLAQGTLASFQAQTWIEEKGELRRYRSRFDGTPRVATSALVRERESREIVQLPAEGHDLLSWMLHLRGDVARQGLVGQASRYSLWDGWKLVWLDVAPGEVEMLETPLGTMRAQSFSLRRTRISHNGDRPFEAEGGSEELGTIWFELSERALPVAMAFRAPIGQVRIELVEYQVEKCE